MSNPYPNHSSKDKRPFSAIIAAASLCVILLVLYAFLGTQLLQDYGLGLFLLTPFVLGFVSSIYLNYRKQYTLKKTWLTGVWSIAAGSCVLVLVAIEGVICIIMASPLLLLLGFLGSLTGYFVMKQLRARHKLPVMLTAVFINPLFMLAEHQLSHNLVPPPRTVETRLLVHVGAKEVWQSLAAENNYQFDNLLFKAGISYPMKTKLVHKDNCWFLSCAYNNGTIDMPVSKAEAGQELVFSLHDTPAPMKELTLYNNFHAPHLHGYFMVDEGRIRLIEQPNNTTLLVATTIYRHNIKPVHYWQLWSDALLDQVHFEVLNTIKTKAEAL
jgi:hypothetical protein